MIHNIRSTFGVSELLKIGETPLKVPETLINNLQFLENQQINIAKSYFNKGDKVLITSGLYKGLDGIFQIEDGLQRAVILINILNKDTPLNVRKVLLEKLN